MSDIKDIWHGSSADDGNKKLPDDLLIAYLEGRLSPQEQHEVELWLSAEGLESDALEGLKQLSASDTKQSVAVINYQLHKTLNSNKRKRRFIVTNSWAWLAVAIILLLTILAYIVIYMMIKKH